MLQDYLPILLQVIVAIGFAAFALVFERHRRSRR